jgi:hypothetical protein
VQHRDDAGSQTAPDRNLQAGRGMKIVWSDLQIFWLMREGRQSRSMKRNSLAGSQQADSAPAPGSQSSPGSKIPFPHCKRKEQTRSAETSRRKANSTKENGIQRTCSREIRVVLPGSTRHDVWTAAVCMTEQMLPIEQGEKLDSAARETGDMMY